MIGFESKAKLNRDAKEKKRNFDEFENGNDREKLGLEITRSGPRIDIDRRNRSDSDFPNVERGSLLVNRRFQCTRKHLQEMHPDSLAVVKHSGHKS